jgi:phospholipid/cholesterol/gamma-HCH transport system substrate-binding protein
MPSPPKVAWSKLRVGLTAIVAMAILGTLIFLLTTSGNVFKRKITLRTFLDDASGTTESSPVRLNGIPVGNIKTIRLSGSKDPQRAVEFTLEVKSEYQKDIPRDSVAMISASNLLGDKFLNITRGRDYAHPVRDGDEIRSAQVQDIPELMAESANLLSTFQNILKRIDSLVSGIESGQGNIGKFVKDEELYDRLNGIAAEGQQLLADVRHGKGTLSRLMYDDQLYEEIRAPLRRIDDLLGGLQKGQGTAGKLMRDSALFDDLQKTIADMRALINNVNSGKGTAGKLLNDDQLYTQLNRLVARLDTTVDRINSGQGTLGQLMTNPQLYEALNGATREMQMLLRDVHANPKKFLTIQLKIF